MTDTPADEDPQEPPPIQLMRNGTVMVQTPDGAVRLNRPKVRELRQLVEAWQEALIAHDAKAQAQRDGMKAHDETAGKLRAKEAKDGKLSAADRKKAADATAGRTRILREIDESLGQTVLDWWVEAIALLSGKRVETPDLDAGFMDIEAVRDVIAHLRSSPTGRGGS